MPIARTATIELHYERSGAGPPLLMIMGMSGTALHWGKPFLSALRQDFDVIVYDHRGVGASSRLTQPITIATLAEDATGLLGALEIDCAHVLGISMGGMVAQELALADPSRVRTLTLGATSCGGPGSSLASPEVLRRLWAAVSSGDRAFALRTAWEINMSAAGAEDADAYAAFLEISRRRVVAAPVIMAQLQACAAHDAHARLPQLEVPTLVLHGTEDQLIPPENARLIADLIQGCRPEMLEGAGHLFFWEQPDRSAELLRSHAAVAA